MKAAFRYKSSATVDDVQTETARVFDDASDLYKAIRQRVTLVAATEKKHAHALGRVPLDVLLGPPDSQATLSVRTFDSQYVYVTASANCNVTLWLL